MVKSEHAPIYTGKEPFISRDEMPRNGELPMRQAIRVESDSPDEKLDQYSRIDYAHIVAVPHDVAALSVGRIHNKSAMGFWQDYCTIMSRTLFGPQMATQIPGSKYGKSSTTSARPSAHSRRRTQPTLGKTKSPGNRRRVDEEGSAVRAVAKHGPNTTERR